MRIEFKFRWSDKMLEISFDSIRVSKWGKWGTAVNGFYQMGRLALIWYNL